MEFNWTTFALEIINFLVLLWILKRFLYKPVMDAVTQRRSVIEKSLAETQAMQVEAESLKRQYQDRLTDWEREKAGLRTSVFEEVNAERARSMAALQAALEQERERSRVLEQQQATELRRALEEEAMVHAGQFAARLLSRLTTIELESRIGEVVLEDLPHLPDEKLQAIRAACQEQNSTIKVTSAYPIGESQRNAFVQALGNLAGKDIACEFAQDGRLMAGFRIGIGPWILHANLLDELRFFGEAAHHGS